MKNDYEIGVDRWIVSKRFDLSLIAIPFAAALLALPTLAYAKEVPLWSFLILIVAFDVAHVWATLYLTYLDKVALKRRPFLYALTPLVAFLVAWRMHAHSSTLFWTILAYVAIFHFIKQQWGFIALYKARAKERSRFDFHLDKWTLWVGALGPVMMWHASPKRQFDWFNAGESFIATLDPVLKPDILMVMAVFALLYLGRQIHLSLTSQINIGKNLWMVASWVSWTVGIGYADHPLVSAAFINLLHGIPFLALVWFRCNRQHEGKPSLVARLSRRGNWLYFYLPLLVLAVVEEAFWDGVVWRVYLPGLLGTGELDLAPWIFSFCVALLSVPQIVHYYLDAWIWKLDGSNPELKEALSL